jgi:peptidase M48-like protein
VEAGTLYLRLFLGAKSFESSELDSLAEKMNVSGFLSSNSDERYFLTKANMAALSLGNKLLFGANYYLALTDKQRLAVAAHEFSHVLGKDGEHRRKRVVAPAALVAVLLAALTLLATGSVLLVECALAVGFLVPLPLLSAAYAKQYHTQEMRSDRLAASFVDGEALVGAIQAAESMVNLRTKRTFTQKIRVRRHPSTKSRVDAILNKA